MAETLSPTPTAGQKQRAPVLSPERPLFLGSNDDQLERAQARAARAAAIRRKPVALHQASDVSPAEPCLGQEQIMELFQNCIKLASENKINQKNTWELNLIDHLCDIIKVEEENDVETNFQKASCTLEAGVRIYSMRVDSVHSEAYKVLGGISRVAQEPEQGQLCYLSLFVQGGSFITLSPLSTLESSFEALNVKKFDVAFAVDPLYHQTTAQFDEGGSKGLLLNNLGVYGGCVMIFDSLEVPGKCMSCSSGHDKVDTIDIAYARDHIEQMVSNISKKLEISPSLKDIVNLFDEDNRRPADTFSSSQKSVEPDHEAYGDDFDGGGHDCSGTWDFINDNQTSLNGEDTYEGDEEPVHHQENELYVSHDGDVDDRFATVDSFLFLSIGLTGKQNAWAGPDHWKYRKTKGPEDPAKENGSPLIPKKQRNKKQAEFDIEFTKALDLVSDVDNIFALPKYPKSLLLPANREPCNTTLPEDCHYQPENLVKLFLLPNVMCLGKRGRRYSDESGQEGEENNGTYPCWDDDCGQFDDGNAYDDVNKIEVEYDKTSKQVDVQALKETLWSSMQETHGSTQETKTLSFKHILASFPADNKKTRAASIDIISPHLCFICVLHLANEHGLSIHGCTNLDDLSIHLPF
ncbi:Condensin complex subunit 2/barren [Cynara cardunculus var. scolymus]|uniref:Condensin complex subunit 2 n=1 Tax=Cynara cardunculus var. scolymus TaxID=59895 RepID=A0A103YKC6_CYNCS|nr:Condensin complex subunit 2/barren [Cynara cardunculus var. scolymus]